MSGTKQKTVKVISTFYQFQEKDPISKALILKYSKSYVTFITKGELNMRITKGNANKTSNFQNNQKIMTVTKQ